jgi:hypothetical protein
MTGITARERENPDYLAYLEDLAREGAEEPTCADCGRPEFFCRCCPHCGQSPDHCPCPDCGEHCTRCVCRCVGADGRVRLPEYYPW